MIGWWMLAGLVLGGIGGAAATGLEPRKLTVDWQSSTGEQKVVLGVMLVWVLVLMLHLLSSAVGWEWVIAGASVEFLKGSIIGTLAAPWLWMHFSRYFDSGSTESIEGRIRAIQSRAYELWLSQGQPIGQAAQHWQQAEAEIDTIRHDALAGVDESASRLLDRYKYTSILLGVSLALAVFAPIISEWLTRAKQVGAFGVSLTLLDRPTGERSPIVLPTVIPESGVRLEDGANAALRILGKTDREEFAGITPDLTNFDELSLIDRDRAIVAWLHFRMSRLAGPPDSGPARKQQTLYEFVRELEDEIRSGIGSKFDRRRFDPRYVKILRPVASCLTERAAAIRDPHVFVGSLGRLLGAELTRLQGQHLEPLSAEELPSPDCSASADLLKEGTKAYQFEWTWPDELHADLLPSLADTPYPALISAYYMAAVGGADAGVSLIESWIKEQAKSEVTEGGDLQTRWYAIRAMMNATQIPYNFGGVALSHRQLIRWQERTTDQFAGLLGLDDPDDLKKLCDRVSTSSIADRIGRIVAALYAGERQYLFELLTPLDFAEKPGVLHRSASRYIEEVKIMRDRPGCFARLQAKDPYYRSRWQGNLYLDTAQLRLALLGNSTLAQRTQMLQVINSELIEARLGLGSGSRDQPVLSLLQPGDEWELSRSRLRVVEAEASRIMREGGDE